MPLRELGELIELGGKVGVTVEVHESSGGMVIFLTPAGYVTVYVYAARNPDAELDGVPVFLVEEQENGQGTGRYVAMADDPYWGRRIQPARFREAPFTETLVMGYRLTGRILEEDVPVAAAPVSFQVTLQTAEDGEVKFWDSEEYNLLEWSEEWQTYVCGPEVGAPVATDDNGRWTYIVPKGHGAAYQRFTDRRDDTEETARQPLARYVDEIEVAYRGRRVPVLEGEDAVINLRSGRLRITATPGATVRVGVAQDAGQMYTVPESGVVEVGNLPEGFVSLVQFMRVPTGEWDPRFGCARVVAAVHEGQTTQVTMPPLEEYPDDGSLLCGRVYLEPGLPAPGVDIVIIDLESGQIVGVAATTNDQGFWSVQIPPEGLGGNPYIMDPDWGSLPIVGMPYSDVVLGAKAYCAWMEVFKTEAWRRDTYGHKNFQYVPEAIWVVDNDTNRAFPTEEAPWGGWITTQRLAKFKYIADPMQLLLHGPQLKSYRLETDHGCEDPDFHLRGQSFSGWNDEPSNYRASGYYPEKKILLGGKIKYNAAVYGNERIDHRWPEAARVGLEQGRHQWFVEMRTALRDQPPQWTCFTDWLCPYCGGPTARGGAESAERGYCWHCAQLFGDPRATDGRGFARSVTLAAGTQRRWQTQAVALTARGGFRCLARYHWRPDLYEEKDEYLRQDGPGMRTNAPRWWALHPHEIGDGKGLGQFNGDQSPSYLPGHDLSYFSGLVGRDLGLAQLKLVFPPYWTAPFDFTLQVDCRRADGVTETAQVTVPAGTRGPNDLYPLGDMIPLRPVPKLRAERLESPYVGVGLYTAVTDIRLVEPEAAPGCYCAVTADVPFLATPAGLLVPALAAEFVALQLVPPGARAHLAEDAVGQLFLFVAREGNIEMRRRRALSLPWEAPRVIVADGQSDYPWAGFDERGTLILVRQRGSGTMVTRSRDQGQTWEE